MARERGRTTGWIIYVSALVSAVTVAVTNAGTTPAFEAVLPIANDRDREAAAYLLEWFLGALVWVGLALLVRGLYRLARRATQRRS